MATDKKAKKRSDKGWLINGGIAACFLCLIGFGLKVVLLSPSDPPQKKVQVIKLIKPPPEEKQKLPEPEPIKESAKQALETPVDAPTPQDAPDNSNEPPPGENLAVDGEGGAGDNAFGLGAKKGGRAITLGDGGGGGGNGLSRLSLLSKYSGYSLKIESDIDKKVKKVLEQNGGRPKGKHNTVVKITLSEQGEVLRFAMVASSGNDRLDQAFRTVLSGLRLSEPPPAGMPPTMTLKITTVG